MDIQELANKWTVNPNQLKQHYDELKEKHEIFTKLMAEKFMEMNRGLIKLQNERDEAREEVDRLRERDNSSCDVIGQFMRERDEARAALRNAECKTVDIKLLDEARAKIKILTEENDAMLAAFARDGAALSAEFTQLKKERDEALKLASSRLDLLTEIDEASGKIESKMEDLQEQLDFEKSIGQIRPDPSRIEIAAMIYSAFAGAQCMKDKVNPTVYIAFKCADELIAAAKEAQ
jgi:hypothetical protein